MEYYCALLAALFSAAATWLAAAKLMAQPLPIQRYRLLLVVNVLVALVFGYQAGLKVSLVWNALPLLVALAALQGAVVCDLQERRIPNLFSAGMLAYFLIDATLQIFLIQGVGLYPVLAGIISGGIPFLFLVGFRKLSGWLFHHPGIGWGDIKLLSALGCLIGLNGVFMTLLGAQIAALVFAVYLLISRRAGLKDTVPFAPFLCGGYLLAGFASVLAAG